MSIDAFLAPATPPVSMTDLHARCAHRPSDEDCCTTCGGWCDGHGRSTSRADTPCPTCDAFTRNGMDECLTCLGWGAAVYAHRYNEASMYWRGAPERAAA